MIIGILTYGRVANFGANLQCTSTYMYIMNHGHTPIYIYYLSDELYEKIEKNRKLNPQIQAHYDYFDSIVENRTELCHTAEDINKEISKNHIDAVIIGADAVLQHHPVLSRLKFKRSIIPLRVNHVTKDRLFPNLFWGYGIDDTVKMSMMSVSSQNSEYKFFTPVTRKRMGKLLKRFDYISARDNWTQKMIKNIAKELNVPITPDPVFAFNYNMTDCIPTKEQTLAKFNLPNNYVSISLFRQSLSKACLDKLKSLFEEKGISCVVLPMPDEGVNFQHSFDYVIPTPLSPIDWYALIKYSQGYIGENMHPIVVCLHNAVPCYSIDNWGSSDMLGRAKNNGSSKVEDILKVFGVANNRSVISRGRCNVSAQTIVESISHYPVMQVKEKSWQYYQKYKKMMEEILLIFKM